MTKKHLDGSWYGFLITSFLIAGLAGGFGTYACQIPYQRGEAAQQLLDRLAAGQTIDQAQLTAVLGDQAALLNGAAPLDQRIDTTRRAVRARVTAEAADISRRLRVVIGVITGGAALFGALLLGAAASQAKREEIISNQ